MAREWLLIQPVRRRRGQPRHAFGVMFDDPGQGLGAGFQIAHGHPFDMAFEQQGQAKRGPPQRHHDGKGADDQQPQPQGPPHQPGAPRS